MKVAEEGIEEFLKDRLLNNGNWRERRGVMGCIFALESQTRHLYEARREAKKQRNLVVYGTRDPGRRDSD